MINKKPGARFGAESKCKIGAGSERNNFGSTKRLWMLPAIVLYAWVSCLHGFHLPLCWLTFVLLLWISACFLPVFRIRIKFDPWIRCGPAFKMRIRILGLFFIYRTNFSIFPFFVNVKMYGLPVYYKKMNIFWYIHTQNHHNFVLERPGSRYGSSFECYRGSGSTLRFWIWIRVKRI